MVQAPSKMLTLAEFLQLPETKPVIVGYQLKAGQQAGKRSQESGVRRQEAGGRSQEAGVRRILASNPVDCPPEKTLCPLCPLCPLWFLNLA
jgi:hypothetical protein